MLFADDILLVGENLKDVNNRLDKWRLALEGKGLLISRNKSILSMNLEEKAKKLKL